jgi:hypothetical protein
VRAFEPAVHGFLDTIRDGGRSNCNHSVQANKFLLNWVDTNKIRLARNDEPAGDHFGCRYERVLSDVANEPRRTNWLVQVDLLVANN